MKYKHLDPFGLRSWQPGLAFSMQVHAQEATQPARHGRCDRPGHRRGHRASAAASRRPSTCQARRRHSHVEVDHRRRHRQAAGQERGRHPAAQLPGVNISVRPAPAKAASTRADRVSLRGTNPSLTPDPRSTDTASAPGDWFVLSQSGQCRPQRELLAVCRPKSSTSVVVHKTSRSEAWSKAAPPARSTSLPASPLQFAEALHGSRAPSVRSIPTCRATPSRSSMRPAELASNDAKARLASWCRCSTNSAACDVTARRSWAATSTIKRSSRRTASPATPDRQPAIRIWWACYYPNLIGVQRCSSRSESARAACWRHRLEAKRH